MTKDKDGVEVEEDKVVLSKNEFSALMGRIERLENPGVPVRQKFSKEHIAFLRLWEGQLVVKVGSAKEDFNLPSESKDRIQIDLELEDLEGKRTKKTVNYLDFLTHAGKVRAKFTKIEHKERSEVELEKGGGGYSNKRAIDSEGRATPNLTSEEIALEVGFKDPYATVEVIEGEFTGKTYEFTPETITALNA